MIDTSNYDFNCNLYNIALNGYTVGMYICADTGAVELRVEDMDNDCSDDSEDFNECIDSDWPETDRKHFDSRLECEEWLREIVDGDASLYSTTAALSAVIEAIEAP